MPFKCPLSASINLSVMLQIGFEIPGCSKNQKWLWKGHWKRLSPCRCVHSWGLYNLMGYWEVMETQLQETWLERAGDWGHDLGGCVLSSVPSWRCFCAPRPSGAVRSDDSASLDLFLCRLGNPTDRERRHILVCDYLSLFLFEHQGLRSEPIHSTIESVTTGWQFLFPKLFLSRVPDLFFKPPVSFHIMTRSLIVILECSA